MDLEISVLIPKYLSEFLFLLNHAIEGYKANRPVSLIFWTKFKIDNPLLTNKNTKSKSEYQDRWTIKLYTYLLYIALLLFL